LPLYLLQDSRPRAGELAGLSGNHEDETGRVRGGLLGSVRDSLVSFTLEPGMRASEVGVLVDARISRGVLRVVAVDGDSVSATYRRR